MDRQKRVVSQKKKRRMSADICAERMEELTADITSLEDRVKLLQIQRLRDGQLKQYLRASAMEEEISKIRTEKRKKEEEIMLIKKKKTKASWYKAKSSTSSSKSSTSFSKSSSSCCDEKCRPLSTFWTKKDEVDIVDKEVEELPTSASDIQLTEPESDTSLNKAVQDGSDKNRTFL